MDNIKELFYNKWVSIRQIDDWVYAHFQKSNSNTVGVIPYRIDMEYGLMFGAIKEKIPCHTGENYYLLTGATENNDPEQTAINELKEEAGIDVHTEDLIYIGKFYGLKHSDCYIHLYAVNTTGKKQHIPKGDGSKHEQEAEFSFHTDYGLLEHSNDPLLLLAIYKVKEIA